MTIIAHIEKKLKAAEIHYSVKCRFPFNLKSFCMALSCFALQMDGMLTGRNDTI